MSKLILVAGKKKKFLRRISDPFYENTERAYKKLAIKDKIELIKRQEKGRFDSSDLGGIRLGSYNDHAPEYAAPKHSRIIPITGKAGKNASRQDKQLSADYRYALHRARSKPSKDSKKYSPKTIKQTRRNLEMNLRRMRDYDKGSSSKG